MKSHTYLQNSPLAWRQAIWCKYLSQFYRIHSAMPTWGNLYINPASPGLSTQHCLVQVAQISCGSGYSGYPCYKCDLLSVQPRWCLQKMVTCWNRVNLFLSSAVCYPSCSWFAVHRIAIWSRWGEGQANFYQADLVKGIVKTLFYLLSLCDFENNKLWV